jgi:anti-sigma factor ChrR (cupin superfamily)
MSEATLEFNADLKQRVAISTADMEWTPSPGGQVLRKRLHLFGRAEAGQVTSVVRYQPGSRFPRHDHPEGEEILVLEGVFSDEHGHWPAGTYLLNPEGFSHEPYSEEGCLLFVKLRQFPGHEREHVAVDTRQVSWRPSVRKAVSWKKLYAQEPFTDSMRLEAWDCPADIGRMNFPAGAELFVIRGSFSDAHGAYPQYSWLRLPPGSELTPTSDDYCELYIKEGGFTYLRSA